MRGEHLQGPSFLERLIAPLIFCDLPARAFMTMRVGFALLVAVTIWLVPPIERKSRSETGGG
jgi:hypothetical protein